MAALSRKAQQGLILGLGALAILIVTYVMMTFLTPKPTSALGSTRSDPELDFTIVKDRTSAAAPEMTWVTKSEEEINELKKLVDNLSTSLEVQQQTYQAQITKLQSEYDETLLQAATKIAQLEEKVDATSQQQKVAGADLDLPDYSSTGSEFIKKRSGSSIVSTPSNSGVQRQNTANNKGEISNLPAPRPFGQTFALASNKSEGSAKVRNTLKNYIPAGSYAPALVLSGADAATNVSDRENPIPVLFRITGPAVTAGRKGKGAKIDIEGCTVQGSAVGDLSSERVRVRLISMTCIKSGHEVIETAISGYMTSSGKAGARGQVVSREGGLVTNAAIAGALDGLAGISEKMSGAGDAESVADLTSMATRAATAAGAGGVKEAASTLSEYYISRAEQYQPVISLYGGTKVELVFMEGISLK